MSTKKPDHNFSLLKPNFESNVFFAREATFFAKIFLFFEQLTLFGYIHEKLCNEERMDNGHDTGLPMRTRTIYCSFDDVLKIALSDWIG